MAKESKGGGGAHAAPARVDPLGSETPSPTALYHGASGVAVVWEQTARSCYRQNKRGKRRVLRPKRVSGRHHARSINRSR